MMCISLGLILLEAGDADKESTEIQNWDKLQRAAE